MYRKDEKKEKKDLYIYMKCTGKMKKKKKI
jgi:hypothetical protein